MNKIFFVFLLTATYSHSALSAFRSKLAKSSMRRALTTCNTTRRTACAIHTAVAVRASNLSVRQGAARSPEIVSKTSVKHAFETAANAPRDVHYNPNTRAIPSGNYSFAPFHHFGTFTQKHDKKTTYIYVGSEDPIEEDSLERETITTQQVTVEKKEISEYFGMLSFNVQAILKKEILKDAYFFNNSKSTVKPHFTITSMLAQLNPILRAYYEKCIIDLAMNKPSLSLSSVDLRGQVRCALYDPKLVTAIFLYITTHQSTAKSFISGAFGLISQAPQKAAAGILSITSGLRGSNQTSSTSAAKETLDPHALLQIHAGATQEEIKQAYYAKRFEAESRNDAVAVQALTDAYNKLKK